MDATDTRSEKDEQFIEKLLATKTNYRRNIASYLKSGTLRNNKAQRNSTMKFLKGKLEKFGDDEKYIKRKKQIQKLI